MSLEFVPYLLTHERLKEAVQVDADLNTLLRLVLDAEEALTAYRDRLERQRLVDSASVHWEKPVPAAVFTPANPA